MQADIGAGLRPQNMADMRAFLNLSGFLTDFLPLCGGQPFRGCAHSLYRLLVSLISWMFLQEQHMGTQLRHH